VSAELQVRGCGKVKHLINGAEVMEYEQPQLDPKDKDGAALGKAAKGRLLLDDMSQDSCAPLCIAEVVAFLLPQEGAGVAGLVPAPTPHLVQAFA
jgi:hypothetical protein